jgi:hypothetical protein
MSTWDEIVNQTDPLNNFFNYIEKISEHTKNTTICYLTAFTVLKPAVPSPFHSIIDQDMQGFMTCSKGIGKKKLDLIIHTPGGDYEATKRIINYLHETYEYIRVFVPHMAMSGGTLIACGADEIYMGPYSSLGPTDPQVYINNNFVPIDAVINEFEEAFKEVKDDPSKALLWNERLKMLPLGQFKAIENMKLNSQKYLEELLLLRNLKNNPDKSKKAAEYFNSYNNASTHGKGVSLQVAKEYLNVKDLRVDKLLEDYVLSVYHASSLLFQRTSIQKIIANNRHKSYINQFQ